MRELVTIEKIAALNPIEGADLIEVATVRGWQVVVKKGEFQVGDDCLYFEIDSMLPVTDTRFEFLAGRGIRTDADGNTGHVLRTMKMKGQYSQGLVMPVEQFDEIGQQSGDIAGTLGVIKWEPPIPAELSGQMRGSFPSWCSKTDSERIQNLPDIFPLEDNGWLATEKIDGMSCTMTLRDDEFHVASRNVNFIESPNNTMWRLAREHGIEDLLQSLRNTHQSVTLQGEVFGEGIQKNRLKMKGHHLRFFNLSYDHEDATWGNLEWFIPADLLVPPVPLRAPESPQEALEQVEALESLVAPGRPAEGVVWRPWDRKEFRTGIKSFKVLSNKYLLKTKE